MTEPRADVLARAYGGKKVLVTGHTGFKGAWLVLWLARLGARVTGLSLAPPTSPSLFQDLALGKRCDDRTGDVRDEALVRSTVAEVGPDVILHLAAQAIVHEGYRRPVETFNVNVGGTANVLDAVRSRGRPCAVVIVTSDKCYAPGGDAARREGDPLGGDDPYSASKAAAEIVVAAYRHSYFPPARLGDHGVAVASARAGNVIGGGDWAPDRILPDAMRALGSARPVPVRNPGHVRPWQHVLEPLSGYLLLGARLGAEGADRYCEAWNFGPRAGDERTVGDLVSEVVRSWGEGRWEARPVAGAARETPALRLDITKAADQLGWRPRWDLGTAVGHTIEWYRARQDGARADDLHALCLRQVDAYLSAA